MDSRTFNLGSLGTLYSNRDTTASSSTIDGVSRTELTCLCLLALGTAFDKFNSIQLINLSPIREYRAPTVYVVVVAA